MQRSQKLSALEQDGDSILAPPSTGIISRQESQEVSLLFRPSTAHVTDGYVAGLTDAKITGQYTRKDIRGKIVPIRI